MIEVQWGSCFEGDFQWWCSFDNVDLKHDCFENLLGVYVIFYPSRLLKGVAVRVGQGDVAERISKHRGDNEITKYSNRTLLVTWAEVQKDMVDGVERYLADNLKPLVGHKFPDVEPIEVNLPF